MHSLTLEVFIFPPLMNISFLLAILFALIEKGHSKVLYVLICMYVIVSEYILVTDGY